MNSTNVDFFTTLNANRVPEDALQTELATAARIKNPQTFQEEARRLAGFVNTQQVTVEVAAKAIFLWAHSTATGSVSSSSSSSRNNLQDIRSSIKRSVDDSIALQEFYAASRRTLVQIAATADEQLPVPAPSTTYSSLLLQMDPLLQRSHLNSSLVCIISDTYNALSQAEEKLNNKGGEEAMWQSPSSFQRATTKYWVKNEHLTKLMMICAAEAPLLVYGKKGPLTSTKASDAKTSDGDKLWETLATVITSIYFDADDMTLYKERLKRAEGAQLLRVRWYGTKMPKGEKDIFVELKTHHERWVAQKSVKERAIIQERDMAAFLDPTRRWTNEEAEAMILRAVKPNTSMKPKELAKQTKLLLRMHNLVVNHKLTACVRSVYDRAAFQSPKSNGKYSVLQH
jgi:SPX domain protein involved in polyphosphate accumulation